MSVLSWWRKRQVDEAARSPAGARLLVEKWEQLGGPRTMQLDNMEITFPPDTTPDQVDQWIVVYRERVPGPWFGPDDSL